MFFFLTYLLISKCNDAAFIRCNFNLVLKNSINLVRCSQYKRRNAEELQKEKKKKDTGAIFYILALPYQGPSAEHASRFPCLMQHIESELMKAPPRGMSVIGAASKMGCQRNRIKWGGTAILSLPYRLFINLTIRSDACLLLESVHIHSNLTSTYQLAIICFSVQGWLTTNAFSFWRWIFFSVKYI